MTEEELPGKAVQPIPVLMSGGLSAQHLVQGDLQSQQIIIPQPIHPKMGNISNTTFPQNTAILDHVLGIVPPQLPTEEDLLKSPDDAGTPVNMEDNFWQNLHNIMNY